MEVAWPLKQVEVAWPLASENRSLDWIGRYKDSVETEGSGNLAFHQGKIAEQSTICGPFHKHEPKLPQRGHRIGHNTERAKDQKPRKGLILLVELTRIERATS